ncbi:related to lipase/esterase [Fusarium torulosum]|uniref:Related to lipase/esterase n=1 Tax=Fusarium torulosum TaxID=33205 RepID=A0AAE8MIY6_9HYPO|nr:related to lipase/esterase [Fusarium torulosum]
MADFTEYGAVAQEWLTVKDSRPAIPSTLDLKEMQRLTNMYREQLAQSELQKLTGPLAHMKDYTVTARDGFALEVRTYRPVSAAGEARLPIYIHLHGGGYVFGNIASEDAICTAIATGANVTVVNLNYRHAPDYAYPTAWEDTEDTFHWVHDHIDDILGIPSQVVIGGISAGAQLAASLTLRQNISPDGLSRPKLAGQVLMIPALVHPKCYDHVLAQMKDPSLSSYVQNADAPMINKAALDKFSSLLKVENPDPKDVRLNIGLATTEQVKGLPPTVFGIAGLDPLRDESLLYGMKLVETGVPTDVHVFKGLPHGFRRFGDQLTESKRWDAVMENGIKWALSNPEPSAKFEIKLK